MSWYCKDILTKHFYKAFLGAGVVLPKHKKIIISVKDADKQEVVPLAQRFEKLGYEVYATRSTADVLRQNGVDAIKVNKIHQEAPTVMDLLLEHKIDIVIDTPTQDVIRTVRFLNQKNINRNRC